MYKNFTKNEVPGRRREGNLWRFVMRVSFIYIMLLIGSAQLLVAHTVTSQALGKISVTIEMDGENLESLFAKIERQTSLKFVFAVADIEQYDNITLKKDRRSVKEVLDLALKKTGLAYEQTNNNVLIFKVEGHSEVPDAATPKGFSEVYDRIITGRVTDERGEGLAGTTVAAKGTTIGTATGSDGNYRVRVPDNATTLVFSFIGFETQEVEIAGRAVINVTMSEDVEALQEVVVNAGYYTTTERTKTGNISRVTAKDIENQPLTSPIAALQGRMAGVEITQLSGMPGAAPRIRIRGQNSLRDDANDPLYIIDGVPVDATPISTVNRILNPGADPLSTFNLSNIESIEILKDADATAIYGSRGANGVILITTKKGRKGKPTLELNAYSGAGKVPYFMDLLNRQQYIQMRREAFANDGVTPTTANAVDLLVWDTTRYTDWQKELIGGTATITNVQASVYGGSDVTSFRMGASLSKQGTVFPGDFNYQKMTGFFNLNHSSNNKKLNAILSVNYGLDKNHLFAGGGSDIGNAIFLPPNAPAIYNENGELNWENSTWKNPVAAMAQPQEISGNNINTNGVISYELLSGLNLKTSLGYTNSNNKNITKLPRSTYDPASTIESTSYFLTTMRSSWIIEPQVVYNHKIGKGTLDAILGTTFQKSTSDNLSLIGTGFVDESLMENLTAADIITLSSSTGKSEYAYTAVFGRIAYNWQQKLFLNLTGRRDGSSRFGPGKRFANLGAVGAAWIFSEEPFIKKVLPFMSFGKLRASYGITGSDQIGNYGYLDAWSTTNGEGGLYPTQLTNPDYSWETNKKLEAALELGFVNDRIHLSASSYRNRSSNQLVGYPLAAITGFTSVQANLPATVQNTGWEIEMNSSNIQSANFSWRSSLNLTFPKNELIEFPNIEQTSYATRYVVGKPLNIAFLYEYTGVDPETGLYTVLDVNEDGSYSNDDRIVIKNIGREYYGGFNNSLRYKNLQLDFLFEFVKQTTRADSRFTSNYPPGYLGKSSSNIIGNMPSVVLGRWQQEGDNTDIQRYTQSASAWFAGYFYATTSDVTYNSDASYIRLKTLSISYQLPESLIAQTGLKLCKIFIQGQNLLTLTKYKGWDPQFPNTSNIPALRMLTGGVQLKF